MSTTDGAPWKDKPSSDELIRFRSKSPSPVAAGYVVVRDTTSNKTLATFLVPVGFQPLEWIMSWHSGPVFIKRMREFILQDLGVSYTRYLHDENKNEPN